MGGCSAMNCKNRSPAFAMYVFPSESQKTRRQLWILNTRRKDFNPGRGAALCEVCTFHNYL